MRITQGYIFLIPFVLLLFSLDIVGQSKSIDLVIVDNESQTPLSDVHAFLANSTFGAISNASGKVTFQIPDEVLGELIISHISYDPLVYAFETFKHFSAGDTIHMNPIGIEIDPIMITGNRSKKRKSFLKEFLKAFLGNDVAGKKAILKNPEVITFEEKGGKLTAKASDLLQIENEYLGYEIEFLLLDFTREKDGSTKYLGHAKFNDVSKSSGGVSENRKRTYENSARCFLKCLVNNIHEEKKYRVYHTKIKRGKWVKIDVLKFADLVKKVEETPYYAITFDDFLEVQNRNQKRLTESNMSLSSGDLRSFRGSKSTNPTMVSYSTSFLKKKGIYLIVDVHGNVLNGRNLLEYGEWAEMRLASTLPWDYGLDIIPITIYDRAEIELEYFKDLVRREKDKQKIALTYLSENWKVEYVPLIADIIRMSGDDGLVDKLLSMTRKKIDLSTIENYYELLSWIWENEVFYPSYYGDFKAELYKYLDPKFETYFKDRQKTATINLDEILWGGVMQDGIPPLRDPKLLEADEASYLSDGDVVFGFYINGQAKAYPKRILAWHEMFVDDFGGTRIAGVYCTLCGTVIGYNTRYHGINYALGTSGFLYRSNKLMYDEKTQSLWNTVAGKPVIGPLASENIVLNTVPIETTTWEEWRSRHPNTKVLDIDTGFDRDYAEGAAYKAYFSTDRLMFPVPIQDKRLKNKDEVLVIRSSQYKQDPLAIAIDYLKEKGIYNDIIGDEKIVVLAHPNGSARVYKSDQMFLSFKEGVLIDDNGQQWEVDDEKITSSDGNSFIRVPSHNIFWFSWVNSFPKTRLVR